MEVYEAIKADLAPILLIWVVLTLVTGFQTDDSDKGFWTRSGLKVHTDYKTGLQYFESRGGGLVPRLDENGKHMRIEE